MHCIVRNMNNIIFIIIIVVVIIIIINIIIIIMIMIIIKIYNTESTTVLYFCVQIVNAYNDFLAKLVLTNTELGALAVCVQPLILLSACTFAFHAYPNVCIPCIPECRSGVL